jgi:hypothetical protein
MDRLAMTQPNPRKAQWECFFMAGDFSFPKKLERHANRID